MAGLKLTGLKKAYGDVQTLHGIDLEIADGEFMVFVGPSGCGKSTLLRSICGLEEISGGDLYIGKTRMNDVPPAKRGIAMVFQSYALYPHMSVAQNMAFGLKLAGMSKVQIADAVQRAAQILRIEPLLERKPKDLSGGQRQRVAIGRTLGEYWSRKGAAQGVELANFTLAMHFENIHSSADEQAHALHWLKYYAENGFIYAYNEIGYT